jgi:DNA processing protein
MFTVRTVLANRDYDDARPTLVERNEDNVFSMFSGKIDTCVEASNQLIKKMKASIYTGPNDIAEALFWTKPGEQKVSKPSLDLSSRNGEEKLILELLLDKKELEIDMISYQTGIPLGLLSSKLLELEFEGIIKSLPGKKYKIQY